ncbi:MAG TPA: hypothetical protein VFF27_15815 [Bacteroidia bacterium]|jgi:natural product precursor|nr:hypothetical protein [Bacteroidia bacterium]
MKNLKFEKVNIKLTREEMKVLKGGYTLKNGDSYNGDTYYNSAWQSDNNGDKNGICWAKNAGFYDC